MQHQLEVQWHSLLCISHAYFWDLLDSIDWRNRHHWRGWGWYSHPSFDFDDWLDRLASISRWVSCSHRQDRSIEHSSQRELFSKSANCIDCLNNRIDWFFLDGGRPTWSRFTNCVWRELWREQGGNCGRYPPSEPLWLHFQGHWRPSMVFLFIMMGSMIQRRPSTLAMFPCLLYLPMKGEYDIGLVWHPVPSVQHPKHSMWPTGLCRSPVRERERESSDHFKEDFSDGFWLLLSGHLQSIDSHLTAMNRSSRLLLSLSFLPTTTTSFPSIPSTSPILPIQFTLYATCCDLIGRFLLISKTHSLLYPLTITTSWSLKAPLI